MTLYRLSYVVPGVIILAILVPLWLAFEGARAVWRIVRRLADR